MDQMQTVLHAYCSYWETNTVWSRILAKLFSTQTQVIVPSTIVSISFTLPPLISSAVPLLYSKRFILEVTCLLHSAHRITVMAGPKEEWLIWDRRFQFGYSCLDQRLKTNEEATQQAAQLDQNTKYLAATSKHLEDANKGLRDRVQKLEQAVCQITKLDEQIQDLTASSRSLKEENNVLNDRILQLEQEGTHRDQENRLVQEQLKGKLQAQEEDFKSVVVAVRGMHEIDSAERARRGEEIRQLRSQVEALIATRHTPGAHTRDGE